MPIRRSCGSYTTKLLDKAEDGAGASRCGDRPAEPGRAGHAGHRSRYRVAPGSDGQRDRQHAVRRLRPAAGVDHVHAAEPVSRGAAGRSEVQRRSRFAEEYLRAGRRGAEYRDADAGQPACGRQRQRNLLSRMPPAGAAQRDCSLGDDDRAADHQPPGTVSRR